MAKLVKLFLCCFAWTRELCIQCFLFEHGQKMTNWINLECREVLKPKYCLNSEITLGKKARCKTISAFKRSYYLCKCLGLIKVTIKH